MLKRITLGVVGTVGVLVLGEYLRTVFGDHQFSITVPVYLFFVGLGVLGGIVESLRHDKKAAQIRTLPDRLP
jgi:hypothetical protein